MSLRLWWWTNDRPQPSFKKSFQDCCKSFFRYNQRSLIKRKSKKCTVQVWSHLHICFSAVSYIIGVMELSSCFNCLLLHNCVRCLWFAQHKRKTSTGLAINPRFLKTTSLYWRGSNLAFISKCEPASSLVVNLNKVWSGKQQAPAISTSGA